MSCGRQRQHTVLTSPKRSMCLLCPALSMCSVWLKICQHKHTLILDGLSLVARRISHVPNAALLVGCCYRTAVYKAMESGQRSGSLIVGLSCGAQFSYWNNQSTHRRRNMDTMKCRRCFTRTRCLGLRLQAAVRESGLPRSAYQGPEPQPVPSPD